MSRSSELLATFPKPWEPQPEHLNIQKLVQERATQKAGEQQQETEQLQLDLRGSPTPPGNSQSRSAGPHRAPRVGARVVRPGQVGSARLGQKPDLSPESSEPLLCVTSAHAAAHAAAPTAAGGGAQQQDEGGGAGDGNGAVGVVRCNAKSSFVVDPLSSAKSSSVRVPALGSAWLPAVQRRFVTTDY